MLVMKRCAFKSLLAAAAFAVLPHQARSQDFLSGLKAFEQRDYPAAIANWFPLAVNGDARSQASLAFMYYSGSGVPRDDRQSFDWFSKAAEKGQATAQFFLGLHYLFGRGVARDPALAHAWCDIALTGGYDEGLFCREQAFLEMKAGDQGRATKFASDFYRRTRGQ